MSRLSAEVSRLGVEVSRLGVEMSRLSGRMGNVEGSLYEQRYRDNVASRLGRRLRRVEIVSLGEVDALVQALESGRVTEREWDDLASLDVLVRGRSGRGADAPEEYVAMEISITIDPGDVRRARERASILVRASVPVQAYVAGRAITPEAERLARELGVTVLLDRPADRQVGDLS